MTLHANAHEWMRPMDLLAMVHGKALPPVYNPAELIDTLEKQAAKGCEGNREIFMYRLLCDVIEERELIEDEAEFAAFDAELAKRGYAIDVDSFHAALENAQNVWEAQRLAEI